MLAGIIIGALLLIGIVILFMKKNKPKLLKENIPKHLGVLQAAPIQPLVKQLNNALEPEFIKNVKQRFLKNHPKMTEDEFEWRLFELKRYFLMTKILKNTPMFSEDVDEVWHEMLMFTQKYQSFSERFTGKMLHHYPNINPHPAPGERAFFDWVYSQLFTITEYSWTSWGNFFQYPLSKKLLNDFCNKGEAELIEKYFNENDDSKEIVTYLIRKLKIQLETAEEIYQRDKRGNFRKPNTFGDMTSLSLIMVFYSSFYFDEYWLHAQYYAFSKTSATSGCSTAIFCGSSSNSSHKHGPGKDADGGEGGDSGASSCSSCGGGCSS